MRNAEALEFELRIDRESRTEIGVEQLPVETLIRSSVSGSPASAEAWLFCSNSANIVCRTIVARIESISREMIAARSFGDVARFSRSRVRSCSLKVLATSATKIVDPEYW